MQKGWIRWFFISNWGNLHRFGEGEEYASIEDYLRILRYFAKEFHEKAIIEIAEDGGNLHYMRVDRTPLGRENLLW